MCGAFVFLLAAVEVRLSPPAVSAGFSLAISRGEKAVIREIQEELHVIAEIVRPLWLNQAFFREDVDGIRYHELCTYFLLDISNTDLLSRGSRKALCRRCRDPLLSSD